MISKLQFLLLMLAGLSGLPAIAADEIDFLTVDRLTWRCYNEQKWDSVITVGKKALRHHIDYYYLRVRMGVAYYEKHEYIPAATHLARARQFNSGDSFVADYLYRSYLYTNHPAEARLLKGSLAQEDGNREPEAGTPFVDRVHSEAGYTISSSNSPNNLSTLMGKDSLYGEQDLYGNNLYGNLSCKLNLSKRVTLSVGYTYLDFSKRKYIQYSHLDDQLVKIADSSWGKYYVYNISKAVKDTSFGYHVYQHEAYLAAAIHLPRGFRIFPAFHLVHVATPLVTATQHFTTVKDTSSYGNFDSTYRTFDFVRSGYSYYQRDSTFNNYLVGLMVTKDLSFFNLGLFGSWSNLNGKQQIQGGVALSYYPLGNLNLYGTTTITGFSQSNKQRLLLSQVVGARITPWWWAEGDIYYGDYTNANILNGSILYNNSDKFDYRGGVNMVFNLSRHIQLSLIYQYSQKESQQVYYTRSLDPVTKSPSSTQQTQNNTYHTHSIIGGITWKL